MDKTIIKCPFDLEIQVLPDGSTETVQCLRLIRQISGRRAIYDGLWKSKSVIVKIFSDPIRRQTHLKREWDGLQQLHERKIPSPLPLFYGRNKDCCPVLVTKKLEDAENLFAILEKIFDSEKWKQNIQLLLSQVANMHIKGIYQKDLHAGNFLLRGKEIFVLDPAEMLFLNMLTKTMCLEQIVMLLASLPNTKWEILPELAQFYWKQRDWQWTYSEQRYFHGRLKRLRHKNIENAIKKAGREGKRFFVLHFPNLFGIFRRDYWSNQEAERFVGNINAIMENGKVLKDGGTCYVSKVHHERNPLVIKRYNYKGLWHSFRHTLKGTRARRCWKEGYRLLQLGIKTPLPVAVVEKRRFGLIYQSWIINEFVDAPKLHLFLQDPNTTQTQKEKVKLQVDQLLQKLDENRITHGDLKHSNILVTNDGLVLIDLDSLKVHRAGFGYARKRTKDLSRFDSL